MSTLPDPAIITTIEFDDGELQWDMSPGSITFKVISNQPGPDGFVMEYIDYDGCADWMNEVYCDGVEEWLLEAIAPDEVKEGETYIMTGIEYSYTRGDGWTTDDDEDFYPGELKLLPPVVDQKDAGI